MFWQNGSYEIGRPFGIQLRVHWSFLLLAAFLAFESASWGGASAAAATVLQLAAVFTLVTLHELGHSLTAKWFGLRVPAITLWPLGGVAEIDALGVSPRKEFWIAIAGPAVNFALALLFAPLAVLGLYAGWSWPAWLVGANLVLALFNLIPAFPMDGGRILRAWLARRSGDAIGATETAVRTGKWAAIALGVFGFLYNPWLILVAFFVFTTGDRELQAVRARESFQRAQRVVWPWDAWTARRPTVRIWTDDPRYEVWEEPRDTFAPPRWWR